MEEGRGMRLRRRKMRGGKPNTTLERGHPGKPCEDGPLRATNQPLNGRHREGGKSPVTFVPHVRESTPHIILYNINSIVFSNHP